MKWGYVPSWRRSAAVAVLTLLPLIATLAACSSGANPPGPTSPPASSRGQPTTTSSTTPPAAITEPAFPAAHPTAASATDFARFFWEAYNYAYAALDPALLRSISDSECVFCVSAIDGATKAATSGATITGGQVRVLEAVAPPAEISTGTLVTTVVSQAPGTTINPNGEITSAKGFKSLRATLGLAWSGGRWSVHGVDYDKGSEQPWPA